MTPTLDQATTALFAGTRVMGIFRGYDPERTVQLCEAAWDAGVRVIEVPIQNESGIAAFRAAVAAGASRGFPVGAGTVRSLAQLTLAVDAGAAFTVAPGLDTAVAAESVARGIPHFPGVGSATDVHRALDLGLVWMKAFPASVLGAEWVAAMTAPFPEAKFLATGGITATNAAQFLAAGCHAVAMGSALGEASALRELAEAGILDPVGGNSPSV